MMPAVTSASLTKSRSHHGDPGINHILSSLGTIKEKVNGEESDLDFLRDLLQSEEFQSLVKVHQKVITPTTPEHKGMALSLQDLRQQVSDEVEENTASKESIELLELLNNVHINCLLEAHDKISQGDYLPHLPDIPHEVDEDEESVKIVRLVKGNTEPLGATIKLNENTGTIQVARILHGGAADRSGLVHVGDVVLAVNGVPVQGREPTEIVKILSDAVGPITLKLVPGEDCDYNLYKESKVRVKAHFSYDPTTDKIIPCKEAGLAFQRGEILHIVNQDDANWWQARKEGDRNMRAGLIPARQLQERKMTIQNNNQMTNEVSPKSSPKITKALKSPSKFSPKLGKKSKKTKKIMYHAIQNDDYDSEEVVTYEEVEKYYPKLGRYRPLVLVGPSGVGRNELKRRLVATNTNHFKLTIPHTSRPRKSSEVEGEEYYFCSRQDMEKDIANKRFAEFGEFSGNLYGTSMEAIKSVDNSGHVCILCPHPQALKMLRTPDIKPYIIYIKPPNLEKLKETRTAMNAKSTFDEKHSRPFTDDEFQEMIQSGAKIETVYSHLFDQIIVNDDLEKAFSELCMATHVIETEPMWVPAAWVR